MEKIKERIVFETTDGQEFSKKEDAIFHQKELDLLTHKVTLGCYNEALEYVNKKLVDFLENELNKNKTYFKTVTIEDIENNFKQYLDENERIYFLAQNAEAFGLIGGACVIQHKFDEFGFSNYMIIGQLLVASEYPVICDSVTDKTIIKELVSSVLNYFSYRSVSKYYKLMVLREQLDVIQKLVEDLISN